MESLKRQITAQFNVHNFISDLDIVYFCNTFIECRYFRGCTRSFDGKKNQANAFESESQENTTPLGDCLVWRVLNSKLQLH